MTEEKERGTWISPKCCQFPARWSRIVTVAIADNSEEYGSDIPPDMMMIGITTRNGMQVQAHISRDEARALVEAINTLGDRMEGME